ncbi:MAG TPA: L-glutamate gamma-semialdehyde dehydrogenase [Thermodesulfobium narugense]|nr:MAG: 1-pyrroline-5-carboxylate dehydrogenase [Thermodesulfobium narugense]HEM56133.1 L-glutamate gamma-semialdehyde dehydrogenase [Thermodesulfobium narugense]
MKNCIARIPEPVNEPVYDYGVGSKERDKLKLALKDIASKKVEMALIIDGKEVKTENKIDVRCPHQHDVVLGQYYQASKEEIKLAIESAMKAKKNWAKVDFQERAAIFLKAAELLSTKYRYLMNATTMLSISKNVFQAEIDCVCELIDFLRFNVKFAEKIYEDQPISPKGFWNRMQYRPLEGFVFAVPPFNFVSISGNLPTAPVIMGNVSIWKPASSAVYPSYLFMKILQEAGLPDGVINFVPARGSDIGDLVFSSREFAGLHFTGSYETFNYMWKTIANNISNYITYPRIVGETGGKDFIFAHNSANTKSLITAIIRGSFEYQGQKCSAVSRVYMPKSIFNGFKDDFLNELSKIKMGTPEDFTNFINAVINRESFDKIRSYIDYAKNHNEARILFGGKCDDSVGYFIEPTVIVTKNPHFKTMEEEVFGPVVTFYPYDDDKFEETLYLCDKTSIYGLTGAIFAQDRNAINIATEILEFCAGNFYINDKPTGAVVGQQPFGGARASGTNDKAGSLLNLIRWTSARSVKETFNPPEHFEYPFMEER